MVDAGHTPTPDKVDNATKPEEQHSGPVELLRSAVYSGLEKPINGVVQMANEFTGSHIPEMNFIAPPTGNTLWDKAGSIVGGVADFVGVSKLVGKGFDAAGISNSALYRPILEGGISGGVLEGLQPVDGSTSNFGLSKLGQVAVGAGTFATMNGASQWLDRTGYLGRVGLRSLSQDIVANGLAGSAGGVANSELTSLTQGHGLASASDLASGVGTYGAFGAVLGGALHFTGDGRPAITNKSAAGTDAAPTTEQFVQNGLDTNRSMQSPILNWIAENKPELRPANYEAWKSAAPKNSYGEPISLDLKEWTPEQRPAVIQEVRKMAQSDLSSDSNLDAFLSKLKATDWAQNGADYSAQMRELVPHWLIARTDLEREVRATPGLKGRTLRDVAADTKLLDANPQLADALKRSVDAEQSYRQIVANMGIQDALSEAAADRNLPSLHVHAGSEYDGSYYNNEIFASQSTLSGGLNTESAGVLGHEFMHHEQGSYNFKWVKDWYRTRQGIKMNVEEGRAQLQLSQTFDNAAKVAKDAQDAAQLATALTDARTPIGAAVTSTGRGLPENIRQISDNARQSGTIGSGDQQSLIEYFAQERDVTQSAALQARTKYLNESREQQANATGLLTKLRAQMAGLPDAPSSVNGFDKGAERFLSRPLLDESGKIKPLTI